MSEMYKLTKNISAYRNKIQIQLNAIQHHNVQFQCMWTELVRFNRRQAYVMENVKCLTCRYCYWCYLCSVALVCGCVVQWTYRNIGRG